MIDANAGDERTERTLSLAASAALVLAEVSYESFEVVKLVKPFEVNLRKKQVRMKKALQNFGKLLDYELGETTAAATYYMAEIYGHFSRSLMTSERPDGLSPLELEEYELAIEEQAYPFDDKGIEVHESNLELISVGIYNQWIEKSLERLAILVPARYAKPEQQSVVISSLETYSFVIAGTQPVTPTGMSEIAGVSSVTPTGNDASFDEEITVNPEQQDAVAAAKDIDEVATDLPETLAADDPQADATISESAILAEGSGSSVEASAEDNHSLNEPVMADSSRLEQGAPSRSNLEENRTGAEDHAVKDFEETTTQ